MTERSMFWTTDGTGDGLSAKFAQTRHQARFGATFVGTPTGEGPLLNYLNELEVTNPSGQTLRTATGAAIVGGLYYENTANVDKTITTPVVGTTGWRLVLQAVWATQVVRVTLLESTDGVATIPSLTQVADTTWEVSLAYGTITTGNTVTVTDAREFCHFNTAVDNSMIDDDAVDSDQIAAGAIDTAHIADVQVTNAKIADGSITSDKIWDEAVTTGKIRDAGVTLAKLAADSVDDTKCGNRVPQFYRRQGGSAGFWNESGTTTYTPTAVRMQAGNLRMSVGDTSGEYTITFPTAFSNNPLVFLTGFYTDPTPLPEYADKAIYTVTATTPSEFTVHWTSTETESTVCVNWLAIGPE